MATSQNGRRVLLSSAGLDNRPLGEAGVRLAPGLLAGDAATVLRYVAEQFDAHVELLVPDWCWGWANRAIRGASTTSNHASGTAMDLNAPRHPLGKAGTFRPAQVAEIHRILDEVDHVVRWGGDYTGRLDEQHFELVGSDADIARVARRLTAPPPITAPATSTTHEEDDDMTPEEHGWLKEVREQLLGPVGQAGLGYPTLDADGKPTGALRTPVDMLRDVHQQLTVRWGFVSGATDSVVAVLGRIARKVGA